jgi:hypothetical protein
MTKTEDYTNDNESEGSSSISILRSEGPAVSSPVREGGVNTTIIFKRRRCATICNGPSGLWDIKNRTPRPHGTGLLTTGPSDLMQDGDSN